MHSGKTVATLSSFALALVMAAAVPSCTVTRLSNAACAKNEECFEAFGRNTVCGTSGLCEPIPNYARCSDPPYPSDFLTRPEAYPNGILFGILGTKSRSPDSPREAAARLAVKDANAAGGIGGRKVGLLICDVSPNPKFDTLDEASAAVEVSKYLRDKAGVRAILGPMTSDATLAVWGAMKDRDFLILSPSSTSNALTQLDAKMPTDDAPGLLWRTAAPDSLQGAAMANYLIDQTPSVKAATVLHAKGAYAEGLAQYFEASFRAKGGTATLLSFATSAERDARLLEAPTKGAPYLVVIGQIEDASACLNGTIGNPSFESIKFLFSDTAGNTDFIARTASAQSIYPRVFGARASLPGGPVFDLFQLSFRSDNNGVDPKGLAYVANAYDATWMLMYGSSWALGRKLDITGTNLARGFRRIVSTGDEIQVKPEEFNRIKGELEKDRRVNLVGASGNLDFDPVTEETTTRIDIWSITGNQITTVKTY